MPVDYHAWTHRSKADGGTDPLPSPRWARAEKSPASTVQSIPNNSNTDIVWDTYYNTDPDGTFREDTLDSKDILVRSPGIYIVKLFIVWNVTNVGRFRMGISHGINLNDWAPGDPDTSAFGGVLEFSYTTLFHFDGTEELSGLLYQSSGSAKALDYAFLHAVRIDGYEGTNAIDMTTQQP